MIIQFTVGNFKVFKEKATLDMRATSISEHKDTHLFYIGKEKLLKSVAIYGKNASGKSKLVDALHAMRDFVISSSKESQSNEPIEWVDAFRLNTATRNQPSFFDIEFFMDNIRYRYGFEVTKERVEKEWLLERKKQKEYPLFLRIGDEFQIDDKRFKEGKTRKDFTRSNALFLSLVAQLNGELSQKIIAWFDNIVFAHAVCGRGDDGGNKTEEFLYEGKYKPFILSMLKNADVDIEDVEVSVFDKIKSTKTGKEIENDFEESLVTTYHKLFDEKNKFVELEGFDMYEDESSGTIRWFNLLGHFIDALINGKIIVSDEIDSRLHTFLVQSILRKFNAASNTKAQFICTVHDTNLQDSELLRRDQIYFVDKDKFGASTLYPLSDFKTRNDHNYEMNYLKGRYGGIPFINGSLNPLEISDNEKNEKQTQLQ